MIAVLIKRMVKPQNAIIATPWLWLLIFLVLPFLFVLKISFSEPLLAQPPYDAIFRGIDDGLVTIKINLGTYFLLFEDSLYISALLGSLKIAFISTLLCLLIGYPMAYAIATAPKSWRLTLLMLIVLPFWTSFLIRVYAWIGLLKANGLINATLLKLGIISAPLDILYTDTAVYIGVVYNYLPFLILPLYATLVRLDSTLLEAAADLGCRPWRQFLSITLPQSMPGVVASCLLVFIPVMGEFVIPDLLGGPDTLMLGKIMWMEFFVNKDWPLASALAVILLIVLVVPFILLRRYENKMTEDLS